MTKSQAMGRVPKISECTRGGVPTTFVETDINGFRDLVQKLTGVFDGQNLSFSMPSTNPNKSSFNMDSSTSIKRGMEMGLRKTAFKLQDRRKVQRQLEIKLGHIASLEGSPSPSPSSNAHTIMFQGNVLSPTFPSANFRSPITPLVPDPFASRNHSPSSSSSASICLDLEGEGQFSFGDCPKKEPKLLPLFPLHSTNT